MVLDVARRAGNRIAAHQRIVNDKAEPVEDVAVRKVREMIQIEQEQAHQPFDAVGLPATGDILLAQSNIAARHDPAQHVPVLNLEAGGRARLGTAGVAHLAIGGNEFQLANLKPAQRLAPAFLDIGGGYQRHRGFPYWEGSRLSSDAAQNNSAGTGPAGNPGTITGGRDFCCGAPSSRAVSQGTVAPTPPAPRTALGS